MRPVAAFRRRVHSEALYTPHENPPNTSKSNKMPQASLTRPIKTASNLSIYNSRKRNHTSATNITQQPDKKLSTHSEFPYNKWFIRPENRLKSGGVTEQSQANYSSFYESLYKERQVDPKCPFRMRQNSRLNMLQQLPGNDLRQLTIFKRHQAKQKKRVPQLVELLLQKHRQNSSIPHNKK